MSIQLRPRDVATPDGVEWRVTRRWLSRPVKWDAPRRSSESLRKFDPTWPFFGVDSGSGLVVTAAIVAFVLILIPVLFFGFELIALGALLAAGLFGRTLLRQPWVIEATSSDPFGSGRQLEWQVRGWRQSGVLMDQVVSDLAQGREPPNAQLSQ
jgi:hypothetical protein